jgi:hypothetical protein
MDGITYRPWIPAEGMTGTYRHLVQAMGAPDDWPDALRAVVCVRGEAIPIRCDPYAPSFVLRGYPGITHVPHGYKLQNGRLIPL